MIPTFYSYSCQQYQIDTSTPSNEAASSKYKKFCYLYELKKSFNIKFRPNIYTQYIYYILLRCYAIFTKWLLQRLSRT